MSEKGVSFEEGEGRWLHQGVVKEVVMEAGVIRVGRNCTCKQKQYQGLQHQMRATNNGTKR